MYNGTICFNGVKIEFEQTQEHCSINGTTVYKDDNIRLIKTMDHYVITDMPKEDYFYHTENDRYVISTSGKRAPDGWYKWTNLLLYIERGKILTTDSNGYMIPVSKLDDLPSGIWDNGIRKCVKWPFNTGDLVRKQGPNNLVNFCNNYDNIIGVDVRNTWTLNEYYLTVSRQIVFLNADGTFTNQQGVCPPVDVKPGIVNPTGLYRDYSGHYVWLKCVYNRWICQTSPNTTMPCSPTETKMLWHSVPGIEYTVFNDHVIWNDKDGTYAVILGSTTMVTL